MNAAQFTYVDIVNGNLICCICRTPFINPVVTTSCSHTFCSDCIASALAVNPQCPVDRSPLTQEELVPAASIVRNLVDELVVECPHANSGCDFTCQRLLLDSHLTSRCQFVQVECSQEGCSHSILRKDLGKHSEGCPHRLVECMACGRDVRLSEMETHHEDCPATEIICVHCTTTLPRSALTSHHASCPHITVPCTHAQYGCTWTGPRHTLPSTHLPACAFEAIKGFFAIHSAKEKALEAENADLKRVVSDLERSVRAHQRDLDRAKVRLGAWFVAAPAPPIPDTVEDTGSVGSSNGSTAETTNGAPPRPDPLRRRLSVPFNPAVFGVEDSVSDAASISARRSTISSSIDVHSPTDAGSDPYASFTNPNPHPFYLRSNSNNGPSNPVAPLNMSGSLEGTLTSLRSSVVALSGSLDSLERKQDIMLTTETLRMHEDVASLRAIVHGLRMQVHNIMMDRNAYFNNRAAGPLATSSSSTVSTPLPYPSPFQHQRTNSSQSTTSSPQRPNFLSRQPSSSNLASISPSFTGGGAPTYTVAAFPHSHHRTIMSTSSDPEDDHDRYATSSATRYLNQRVPVQFNVTTTTVRRGPEGKL